MSFVGEVFFEFDPACLDYARGFSAGGAVRARCYVSRPLKCAFGSSAGGRTSASEDAPLAGLASVEGLDGA